MKQISGRSVSSSVKKAFDIISIIAGQNEDSGLGELSRKLGMHKTTLFRYLHTMEEIGVLEQKGGRWALGVSLFQLGARVNTAAVLRDRVHPCIRNASMRINETVNFAGLFGARAIYLDKVESMRGLQLRSRVGDELPLHSTALGKAILSLLPKTEQDHIIENADLTPRTRHTITDRQKLRSEVDRVRRAGYSIEHEEHELGLGCAAVPVRIASMSFYGAVSISAAAVRMDEERAGLYVEILCNVRNELDMIFSGSRNSVPVQT